MGFLNYFFSLKTAQTIDPSIIDDLKNMIDVDNPIAKNFVWLLSASRKITI